MKSPGNFLLGLLLTFILPIAEASAAGLRTQYQIKDHGQSGLFIVATDELQITGKRDPEKILPAANAEAVRAQAGVLARALGKEVRLVLYRQGSTRTEFSRRILTRDVLVQLEPGVDARTLAEASGAKLNRVFDALPGHYLFEASEAGGALLLAEALQAKPGV